jgi:GT2 family glycosyltransferase
LSNLRKFNFFSLHQTDGIIAMSNKRIAVLITCHNRRDKTLKCFEALYKQESIEDLRLQVYLVDDGCTDGTAEAIIAEFPETRILKGSGSLYWCGGMRLAWEEALF